jgi:hypothetical protein
LLVVLVVDLLVVVVVGLLVVVVVGTFTSPSVLPPSLSHKALQTDKQNAIGPRKLESTWRRSLKEPPVQQLLMHPRTDSGTEAGLSRIEQVADDA